MRKYNGFTLIELLVVVLIIGILAAIALPQYQKAVLKSRYSSLMPTTKAVQNGEEAYYLTHDAYTGDLSKLDVTALDNPDMTVTVSGDMNYAYTLSTRPDIENNLIMYQKHSANYPGEIHCEAKKDNAQAKWLCESALHATQDLGEGITPGYKEYVIEGAGYGLTPAQKALEDLMAEVTCDRALSLGYTCEVTQREDRTKEKRVCTTDNICSVLDYNEDGSYKRTTCVLDTNNVCSVKTEYTYDAAGHMTSQRSCETNNSDGSCQAYTSGGGMIYTYDDQGRITSSRACRAFVADGQCGEYELGENYDYSYLGTTMYKRKCGSIGVSTGSCSPSSTPSNNFVYSYDSAGNLTSERYCFSFNYGYCSSYATNGGFNYVYDGNVVKEIECSKSHYKYGVCSEWTGVVNQYTYDDEGRLLRQRSCTGTSTGDCNEYNVDNSYDYDYDLQGNQIAAKKCKALDAAGVCTEYDSEYSSTYTYDENGNRIATSGYNAGYL